MSLRMRWLRMQQMTGWPFGPCITLMWIVFGPVALGGVMIGLATLFKLVWDFGAGF